MPTALQCGLLTSEAQYKDERQALEAFHEMVGEIVVTEWTRRKRIGEAERGWNPDEDYIEGRM
jgi:hypothetical protein